MNDEEKRLWDVVEQKVTARLGSALKIASYLEYQMDLLTQVVADLTTAIDKTKLTPEALGRLEEVNNFIAVSSVNFSSLSSPYEDFKLPGAVEVKKAIAEIRKPYLATMLRSAGVLPPA